MEALCTLCGRVPGGASHSDERLFKVNRSTLPLFARYNSGSPRCVHGNPSQQGPHTFTCDSDVQHTPSEVLEVVFHEKVILPATSKMCTIRPSQDPGLKGVWQPL